MKSEFKVYSGYSTGFPIIAILTPGGRRDSYPAPPNLDTQSSVSSSRAMTSSLFGCPGETWANRRAESRLVKLVSGLSAIVVTILLFAAATAPGSF